MKKLKKCPHCGKRKSLVLVDEHDNAWELDANVGAYVHIVCSIHYGGCGSSAGFKKGSKKAAKLWNTRA